MNTKKTIVAIALVAATIALGTWGPGPRPAPPPIKTIAAPIQIDPAREYRIQAADHMIERVTNRINRLTAACDRGQMLAPKAAEFCTTELAKFRLTLPIIREVAARDNEVQWNKAIDIIHKFEADTEGHLVAMQQILR